MYLSARYGVQQAIMNYSQLKLDQSLHYDAKAIANHYRFRPWQVFWRALAVVWLFGNFAIHLYWDKITNREIVNQPKRAREIRKIITALGPAYIKVGQALSTRPDLIRKDFLDELTKLQDQLPAFPNHIAFKIVESGLGRSIEEVYREFSPNPVAAASLGQVYKAVLHSGETVAVKVQRPKAASSLEFRPLLNASSSRICRAMGCL